MKKRPKAKRRRSTHRQTITLESDLGAAIRRRLRARGITPSAYFTRLVMRDLREAGLLPFGEP